MGLAVAIDDLRHNPEIYHPKDQGLNLLLNRCLVLFGDER